MPLGQAAGTIGTAGRVSTAFLPMSVTRWVAGTMQPLGGRLHLAEMWHKEPPQPSLLWGHRLARAIANPGPAAKLQSARRGIAYRRRSHQLCECTIVCRGGSGW